VRRGGPISSIRAARREGGQSGRHGEDSKSCVSHDTRRSKFDAATASA
jgi:hypothetical protein